MVGIASKCRVDLRVARHHRYMGTEREDGFSPGYVLLSFQILTPSIRQDLGLTTPHELMSCLPCVSTRENPPYKGGCPKIGLDRRRGMNQNTPNPELTLGWPTSTPLHPLNEVMRLSPECQPRLRMELDTQVWLPIRDRDGRSCPLLVALCLILEENAEQRLWEGLENKTDSRYIQAETDWNHLLHFPHYVNSPRLSVAPGDPWPRRLSPLILIPCIKHLIWLLHIIK